MKIRVVCCLLFVFFSVAALPAGAQTKPASAREKKAEEEVRRLSAAEVNAFLHNDPKAMDRIWSADYVVTTPFGKFAHKQDMLGMMTSGVLVITSYDRRIEYVRVLGNTAITAGTETVILGGKMPNPGKSTELRFTAVWMQQGGRWQEVARHGSVVSPPAAATP